MLKKKTMLIFSSRYILGPNVFIGTGKYPEVGIGCDYQHSKCSLADGKLNCYLF